MDLTAGHEIFPALVDEICWSNNLKRRDVIFHALEAGSNLLHELDRWTATHGTGIFITIVYFFRALEQFCDVVFVGQSTVNVSVQLFDTYLLTGYRVPARVLTV